MRRLAWLFMAVLCLTALLNAENKTMSGWVCDSSCVVQNGDRASCDATCTETSGNVVFISDDGVVSTIDNPDICASHMNKHVRASYSAQGPQEQKDITQARRSAIHVDELREEGDLGGGGSGGGAGGGK
jgi:hypothetical protein